MEPPPPRLKQRQTKFMDDIGKAKTEKPMNVSNNAEQISYIGSINNNSNQINNFFIQDASNLFRPSG